MSTASAHMSHFGLTGIENPGKVDAICGLTLSFGAYSHFLSSCCTTLLLCTLELACWMLTTLGESYPRCVWYPYKR